MTNIYRKIFYSILFSISFLFVLLAITLGIITNSKVLIVVFSFISIYSINACLALWISTSNVRMTHTKLAWLLSFLIFPIISTIIYLIWGRMPYYAKSVSDYKEEYKKYLKYYDTKYFSNLENDTFDLISKYIYGVRSSTVFCNNNITPIIDNIDFYENVLKLIDSANKTILMCYYLIDDGQFWSSIKEHLINKAKSGVKIYILFDRYGSTNKFTIDMLIGMLQHKNIYISKFESDRDVWTRSANNFRSHKKALIIDNKCVLYGGSNIADEYLSIRKNSPNWTDLNFIIKGDITRSFLIDYCIDWDFNSFLPYTWKIGDYKNCKKQLKLFYLIRFNLFNSSKKKLVRNAINNRNPNKKLLSLLKEYNYFDEINYSDFNENNKAIFVQTGPRYYNNVVVDVLVTAITNAKKEIKIISPYIQLNDSILSALIAANKRNVKVELVTAGSCDDKWFLLDMNRSIYPKLLTFGVNIYEYYGFIHSKLFIIDDEYVISGTFNLDFRSFNSNFETMFIFKNPQSVNETIKYWNEVIKYSKEYTDYEAFKNKSLYHILVQTGLQIIQPLL